MFEIIIGKPSASSSTLRTDKGKSLLEFPSTYTIIDIESTGFCADWDEIIEIAAIKIQDNNIIDEFHSLVKPEDDISDFIEDLTGITNEMLEDAPDIKQVLKEFLEFIKDDILVGYNTRFDINFLYDYSMRLFNKPLSNDHIDLLRIARKCLPDLKNHKLKTVCEHYKIDTTGHHRALGDCLISKQCFDKIQTTAIELFGNFEQFKNSFKRKTKKLDAKTITTQNTEFDETHPLYNKVCVFTGTLDKMQRSEAMQIVADLGGLCANNITKKTNYLIIGSTEYTSNIKNGKTSKMLKAEELILKGQDLQIIPENVFYDMIE